MRKMLFAAVVAFSLTWLASVPAVLAGHSFGVGANYWKTLNDIEVGDVTNIDETGLSWLVSYQYIPEGIFKFELDLEYYPELGAARDAFWSPEIFVLVGGTLYAGAGAGWYYDGDVFDKNPFFMLRAGSISQSCPSSPSTSTQTTASMTGRSWTRTISTPTPSASARRFASQCREHRRAFFKATPGAREEVSHEEDVCSFCRGDRAAQRCFGRLSAAAARARAATAAPAAPAPLDSANSIS